jgi:DNA relaxase NicK
MRRLRSTFEPGETVEKKIYGYGQTASVLETGVMMWDYEKPELGIHLRLPSSALATWKKGLWLLLQIMVNNGGKFTRLDIAYDDFRGDLDLDLIEHHWMTGEVNSRFKSMSRYYEPSQKGDKTKVLQGLTFGIRKDSGSYLRIYNKALEQIKRGNEAGYEHWTRVELETKDGKATNIAKTLLKLATEQERSTWLVGILTGLFDVVLSPGTDTNKSRWSRVVWWESFVNGVSKQRLNLPEIKATLEQVKRWFMRTVSSMAAVILLADHGENMTGYDWLIQAMQIGESKFKDRHRQLIGAT